jgi:para-nitrobenzyl esterase
VIARQPVPSDSVVVDTTAGAVEGTCSRSVMSFLGVPFAAAPFGPRRMQAPERVEPWTGIRPATEYGPTAPKGDYPPVYRPYFEEIVIPGDDCLNLNIWTPELGDAGLPVFVWIHGGSFANGSGSVPEYAGWSFARDGVVCITINYRLGIEGFLYFDDGLANLGLRDQIAALEWVHENVGAFGGDPSKVTVAGESAGAMSVTCLLSSPRAEGLFARAIAQSGFAVDTLRPDQAGRVATHVAETFYVPATREGIRTVPAADLARLSEALVDELEFRPDESRWGDLAALGSPFSPTVDGEILPCNPLDGFRAGRGAGVDLFIGSNRDEARLSLIASGALKSVTEREFEETARELGLSADGVHAYRQLHASASPGDLLATVTTDWVFSLSPIRVAEARTNHNERTWVYRFDHPRLGDNEGLGACHGGELPFIFDCIHLPGVRNRVGSSPSQAVADLAHDIWVDFVRDGTPGWDSYSMPTRATGLIAESVSVASDPMCVERVVWEGVR